MTRNADITLSDGKTQNKKLSEMKKRAEALDANTGFPFRKALSGDEISFICEVKRASPSKGLIAPDFPC